MTADTLLIMNTPQIQVFTHELFGQIRISCDEGKEWFCLSDVCKALEITNPRDVKKRLLQRGVVTIDTPTYNQHGAMVMQPMTYVDEPNLYRCIFQSRKQEAEQFQNWVFEVVLPQIRRTGGYIPIREEDDEKMILCKALMIYKRTVEEKDKLLEAQRPQVMFAEAVTSCEDSILIRDLAKLITQNGVKIGQARLFYWLRLHGYLFQRETRPIQKWVEQGLFDTNVTLVETHHGTKERITTKVTGKGQRYFIDGFVSGRFKYVNGEM